MVRQRILSYSVAMGSLSCGFLLQQATMTRYMSGGQLSGQFRILPAVICVMTCGRGGREGLVLCAGACARYGVAGWAGVMNKMAQEARQS